MSEPKVLPRRNPFWFNHSWTRFGLKNGQALKPHVLEKHTLPETDPYVDRYRWKMAIEDTYVMGTPDVEFERWQLYTFPDLDTRPQGDVSDREDTIRDWYINPGSAAVGAINTMIHHTGQSWRRFDNEVARAWIESYINNGIFPENQTRRQLIRWWFKGLFRRKAKA